MDGLNHILNDSAPAELAQRLASCKSDADLMGEIEKEPSLALSILQNMKMKGNEALAARVLVRVAPGDLPEIKTVETALRNGGFFKRDDAPDISLHGGEAHLQAHKSILALEAPYFMRMRGFREFSEGQIVMEDQGIPPIIYQHIIDCLYLPDQKRQEFISTVDKALLPDMAILAAELENDSLRALCDEELCNSLTELDIDEGEIPDWIQRKDSLPKFAALLQFISRVAGEVGELGTVIDQMATASGAAQLAAKCTPEETALFATLQTQFGQACQIPPGTFGKAEWEKTFPVIIDDVPPLPANIHAILEQEDPCEPGKKVKDMYQLFLRPEFVTLKEGSKVLSLNFDGVEELAKKATNEKFRTRYEFYNDNTFRGEMNKIALAKAGWVLIRKDVVPDTRDKNFKVQQEKLKGNVEVPKLMDAILLNILTNASEGKCLYGQGKDRWTYTRCQEPYKGYQTVVGGFAPSSGLGVDYDDAVHGSLGLAASWKF